MEFRCNEKGRCNNIITSFSSLLYGENIKCTTNTSSDITKIVLQTPRTKGKYIFGIMAKDEVEKSVYSNKVVFVEISISHKSMSGMVVLFITQQHSQGIVHGWNENNITKLRHSKP